MSFQGGVQKLRLENSVAARLRKISEVYPMGKMELSNPFRGNVIARAVS